MKSRETDKSWAYEIGKWHGKKLGNKGFNNTS